MKARPGLWAGTQGRTLNEAIAVLKPHHVPWQPWNRGKCSSTFTACGLRAPGQVRKSLAFPSALYTALACRGGTEPKELPEDAGDVDQKGVGKTHVLPGTQARMSVS